MEYTILVPKTIKNANTATNFVTIKYSSFILQQQGASTEGEIKIDCMQSIRECYKNQGISEHAVSIIIASWRESTLKQYECYFKKWCTFCSERQIDPMQSNEKEVLEFLTMLYRTGLGYSGINSARSALSTILWNDNGVTIGNFPTVKRFMKGVFENRPSVPRYQYTWDVNIVLEYLRLLYPLNLISLEELSHKLVILLALLSGQRAQALVKLKLNGMILSDDKCIFIITEKLKNTSSKRPSPIVTLPSFGDKSLCIVHILREYLLRTNDLRNFENQLIISYCKPFKAVSTETISRWIKKVMYEAGIDVEIFNAHSTRSASTSAAVQNNMNVEDILKTVGWSNAATFAKFYHKPIAQGLEFGQRILSGQC